MQKLMAAVRRACSPAVWSRGVELSRAGAVLGERQTDEEIELRVTTQGGIKSLAVVLYPEDVEWSCDCDSRDDACVHVAASVIALMRARQDGQALPQPEQPVAKISYRLGRTADGLTIDRYLTDGASEQRLEVSLTALAQRASGQPRFVATAADMAVELLLGGRPRGLLSWQTLLKMLALLQDCPDVRLDGKPVQVGEARPVMRARLEGRAGGWFLSLVQDPTITEVFANGAVLCGSVVRPIGELGLSSGEVEEMRRGRFIAPEAIPNLVTDVLPSLRRRVPVDVVGVELPETVKVAPRIVIESQQEGGQLSLLPTLVYGDPPHARIDLGQLKHLGGPIVVRDADAEGRLTRQLRDAMGLEVGHRVTVTGAEAVQLADKLRGWRGGNVQGEGHRGFYMAGALKPRLQLDTKQFDIEFEAAAGSGQTHHASGAAVMAAWQMGESLVPLMEGGFAPLPLGWLEKHGHRVLDLLAARDSAGALPTAAQLDLARLCDDLNHPKPPSMARLQAQLQDFSGIPTAPLPADLTAQLRDYQRRGVDWMTFLRAQSMGAMLADDMGLGKTLQALCTVRGRTLVVAPTSVLTNWADEARRFRPSLRVCLYHGANRRLDPEATLVLTSYALMRLDSELLARQTWDAVVLDEAQTIKNPDSQVAQAAYQLQAEFRLTLTGTPVENRLDELWSQFHFINRGLLGGRTDFADRYAKPIANGEKGAAAALRERIRPFMLRRLKREVAPELPPRTDVVLRCTLGEAERSVYDAIRATTMKEVIERLQGGGNVMAALEALLRLRQACCHPALVPGQEGRTSAKVELLLETLEEALAEGHKALVFSQWTHLLDLIEPLMRERGMAFNRLDGSTADRGAVVREFQADDGPPVMLVSLKAGGTGLNLTAADHVFLLDPWWNPAVEDQAADRAHRIGQERPVLVHRLVAEDTVEERIMALQEEKRAVAQAALEGADRGASLTRDDLLALLQ